MFSVFNACLMQSFWTQPILHFSLNKKQFLTSKNYFSAEVFYSAFPYFGLLSVLRAVMCVQYIQIPNENDCFIYIFLFKTCHVLFWGKKKVRFYWLLSVRWYKTSNVKKSIDPFQESTMVLTSDTIIISSKHIGLYLIVHLRILNLITFIKLRPGNQN